jgi:hypothetical protein
MPICSLAGLLIIVAVAVLARALAPHDPFDHDLARRRH